MARATPLLLAAEYVLRSGSYRWKQRFKTNSERKLDAHSKKGRQSNVGRPGFKTLDSRQGNAGFFRHIFLCQVAGKPNCGNPLTDFGHHLSTCHCKIEFHKMSVMMLCG